MVLETAHDQIWRGTVPTGLQPSIKEVDLFCGSLLTVRRRVLATKVMLEDVCDLTSSDRAGSVLRHRSKSRFESMGSDLATTGSSVHDIDSTIALAHGWRGQITQSCLGR